MGQVFTWDAVSKGEVPSLESFRMVTEYMREAILKEPAITSALLCGSVPRGDFTPRSDVDCAVVYDVDREKEAVAALHQIGRWASALHVPVNFIPCDTMTAKTRLNHMGPAFSRHIETSVGVGGTIKGEFLKEFGVSILLDDEIESYLRAKMYNLQEAYTQMTMFSEERLMSFFKKAYEAPVHVARKILTYCDCLGGDSKNDVILRYKAIMSTNLSMRLQELVGIDREYTEVLVGQEGNPNKEKYEKVLGRLEAGLPKVLEFLRMNIRFLTIPPSVEDL